ncbi:hypothetical protein BOX15_Mlig024693g3 [Macrostomum lignano]|uniref:Uncharacterized protein n=2 Tax=Macrostomum lignano TaxID=282301 RepID=A0A267FRV0_9PLAT|nr:hypothetical protein BOX15_Mlig024693g1 [Macrostomum lignano]PAA75807.1 hypothetical protein BOX15_Mlig024693g3 [Macrostomum lignano]
MTSNLYRSASLDRLLTETDFRHSVAKERCKCSMRGYPHCCTEHYYSYRYWPYYLEHRVADHRDFIGCYSRYPPPYYWPRYYYYPYELYPRYYSEYLRGYNYGLWKYNKCPDWYFKARRRCL